MSLPTTPSVSTFFRLTVCVAGSSTHTFGWSSRVKKADSGSRSAVSPELTFACTPALMPRRIAASSPATAMRAVNVRVAASAPGDNSRRRPCQLRPGRLFRLMVKPSAVRTCSTSLSGTAMTISFSLSPATRTTVWPADTTWPASASTAVTTPSRSATSVA